MAGRGEEREEAQTQGSESVSASVHHEAKRLIMTHGCSPDRVAEMLLLLLLLLPFLFNLPHLNTRWHPCRMLSLCWPRYRRTSRSDSGGWEASGEGACSEKKSSCTWHCRKQESSGGDRAGRGEQASPVSSACTSFSLPPPPFPSFPVRHPNRTRPSRPPTCLSTRWQVASVPSLLLSSRPWSKRDLALGCHCRMLAGKKW